MKDKVNNNTLCCICAQKYSQHKSKDHEFTPCRFIVYSADLDEV